MNGIADNTQLQFLLMGLDELNENQEISEKHLEIVKGLSDEQITDESIVGKWNMYNWEYLKNPTDDDHSCWIWGEGIPSDISKFENYRVVLLGKPSYDRLSKVQRTFNNLQSEIVMEKVLNSDEIEGLLAKMKK